MILIDTVAQATYTFPCLSGKAEWHKPHVHGGDDPREVTAHIVSVPSENSSFPLTVWSQCLERLMIVKLINYYNNYIDWLILIVDWDMIDFDCWLGQIDFDCRLGQIDWFWLLIGTDWFWLFIGTDWFWLFIGIDWAILIDYSGIGTAWLFDYSFGNSRNRPVGCSLGQIDCVWLFIWLLNAKM